MCDSCGDEDVDLTEVRRLYVTPETWDRPGSSREAATNEFWCGVCCVHYPHRTIAS